MSTTTQQQATATESTVPQETQPEGTQPQETQLQGTQPLTALVPIIPGHREQVRKVLAALYERIAAGGPTPLEDIGTVHFGRWVVVPDDQDGGMLLFASNFDGPWDEYIEDFAAQSADSFDAITRTAWDGPSAAHGTSMPSRSLFASMSCPRTSTTAPTRWQQCSR